MASRAEQKNASLLRILDAGAARLRTEGRSGAGIARVMQDAGLTHGAFYVHFANKCELDVAALRHALADSRFQWLGNLQQESWIERLKRLARRYLSRSHRDDMERGCALAALVSETARSESQFRQAYEAELRQTLRGICCGCDGEGEPDSDRFDQAIVFMALCLGGLTLARAVADTDFSEHILRVCDTAVASVADPFSVSTDPH